MEKELEEKHGIFDKPLPVILDEIQVAAAEARKAADEARSAGETAAPGIYEKVLSRDTITGNCTRLLKVEPGVETTEALCHDTWEEFFVIRGGMIDKSKNLAIHEGFYGC